MKLRKVISGGQTGADRTALEEAKLLGFETGGTAPKHYHTEAGDDLTLKSEFGLEESDSYDYKPRTHQNVADADATVWFGKTDSPGYWCTRSGTIKHNKPFICNPVRVQMENVCDTYATVNFAGNRKSKNPGVVKQVQDAFQIIKSLKAYYDGIPIIEAVKGN